MSYSTICHNRAPIVRSPLAAIVLTAMLAIATQTVRAQAPNAGEYGSTYYLVAFPDTTTNVIDSRYPSTRVRTEASLWIYSSRKNRVRVTVAGNTNTIIIDSAGYKIYQLPNYPAAGGTVVNEVNVRVPKAIQVESDYPIILTCYFAHHQGAEAWTPLPVEQWGNTYLAASIPGEVVNDIGIAGETEIPITAVSAPAEILVIAAYDNTLVTLTPPAGARFVGDTASRLYIPLNRGDVYQVQSMVDTRTDADKQPDIANTTIVADKPIGVISGNTRARVTFDMVGLENNIYRNMLIEWLRPTEQYGTEFVYMPTWDDHRDGVASTSPRDAEFVRIYPRTRPLHGSYTSHTSKNPVEQTSQFTITRDTIAELRFIPFDAAYIKTDAPAQAMMHSSAVVKFEGSTPCFRGIPCLNYSGWGPYMVELTPREQWVSFAPFYTPPNPGNMKHYINVVADSLSAGKIYLDDGTPFHFDQKVVGSSLVWGTMTLKPGQSRWLSGRDGATFGGYVYGLMQGDEQYRPGRAKKKGDAATASAGDDVESPQPLHPAEYEEYGAVSYGYPLVSTGKVVHQPDSIVIDTLVDCAGLTIRGHAVSQNPVGFRLVSLDPATVVNAKLVPVNPQVMADLIGRSSFEVRVVAIDPTKKGSATVVITDRTGKSWHVQFESDPAPLEFSGGTMVNFGSIVYNAPVERTITITNPLARPVSIDTLALAIQGQGFTIAGTNPDGPARAVPASVVLAPGASMSVVLRARPAESGRTTPYVDSLVVKYDCKRIALPIRATAPEPEIVTSDLDFGALQENDSARTLWLKVCNVGPGLALFENPNGGAALEWPAGPFTVPDSALAHLRAAQLGTGECDSLPVTFTPQGRATYKVTARLWGSTRFSRDTSVWRAAVGQPLGVEGRGSEAGYALAASTDAATARINYALPRGGALRLEIYDASGALLETILDAHLSAGSGTAVWSAAGHPSGIYFCRAVAGGWSRTVPFVIAR